MGDAKSNPVPFSFNPRRRAELGLVLFVLLITASCNVASKPVAIAPQHLATLFAALQSGDTAPAIQAVLAETSNAPRTDPNWPALTYLVGEAYLKRKDVERARATFRELAEWAASDQPAGPYKDQWGGSGLAAVGIWRWLRIVDLHDGTPAEIEQALKAAASLRGTRLYTGMVRSASATPRSRCTATAPTRRDRIVARDSSGRRFIAERSVSGSLMIGRHAER